MGALVFLPHQTSITQRWLQKDIAGNRKTYWPQRRGEGVNYRKLILLCVNVFVSLRSVVVLLWDFPGGFDLVEF